MEIAVYNKGFIKIKPHHLLDFLYDLAIDYSHENEDNPYGSNNGILCWAFIHGYIKKIEFTPYIDDICAPCKKIVNGKCTDLFDEDTTKLYGERLKNDFNYNLDIKLNVSLPDVFKFNEVQNTIDVLKMMQKLLSEDIVDLYLWKRPLRYKKTQEGISKAIAIYDI